MYPILFDVKTKKIAKPENMDSSLFWWAEGNGSCDCNRCIAFDDADYESIEGEMIDEYGEGVCYGSNRIIAVDVVGDLDGMTKEEVLSEMNSTYDKTVVTEAMSEYAKGI